MITGNTYARERGTAYAYIAPAVIVLFAVVFAPMAYAFYLSFFDIKGVRGAFTGLGNYINILKSDFFWKSTRTTLYFTVVSVALEFTLGMLSALLLTRKFVGRAFVRAVFLMPWALPTVVNGVLWAWIFNASYGSLNGLLLQFGLIDKYIAWLSRPLSAMNCVIAADVWKNFSMMGLILLAGLQTIPDTYYESAKIDGANAFQRFFRVTVPILRPSILVCLVLRTMEAFKVFDIIYTMTKGGPANGTQVISYYTYNTTFQYSKFGYGAALSYVMSIVILMLAMVYIHFLRVSED